jgi:hypothetical protein
MPVLSLRLNPTLDRQLKPLSDDAERLKSDFDKKAPAHYFEEHEDDRAAIARRADQDDEIGSLDRMSKSLGLRESVQDEQYGTTGRGSPSRLTPCSQTRSSGTFPEQTPIRANPFTTSSMGSDDVELASTESIVRRVPMSNVGLSALASNRRPNVLTERFTVESPSTRITDPFRRISLRMDPNQPRREYRDGPLCLQKQPIRAGSHS